MSKYSRYVAVIPAAGIGQRMQASVAKQYLQVNDKTLLEHTVACFLRHPRIAHIIVALHPEDRIFNTLECARSNKISTVIGGAERANSVLAALELCHENDWVLVHDAARPCLYQAQIDALITQVETSQQGAILALPARDTLKREAQGLIAETVDRSVIWQAQTPQVFAANKLKHVMRAALRENIVLTDEASAMEWAHEPIALVAGRSDNIKVTTPEDLPLVAFLLNQLNENEAC